MPKFESDSQKFYKSERPMIVLASLAGEIHSIRSEAVFCARAS